MGEPTAGCLLIHGLGGGPYEFGALSAALHQMGIVAAALTLPGHEGPGPKMPASGWEDWASAVGAGHRTLVEVCGGRANRVPIVGFSTGATLALWLAARERVGPLVLLAPFLAVRHLRWMPDSGCGRVVGAVAGVLPSVPRRGPAIRDRDARREAAGMDRFRTFHLGAARSALQLIDNVRPRIPGITAPTLIVQGRRDSVVEPSRARWLHDHLGSTDKQLVFLNDSDHLLMLDSERQHALSLITTFLADRLPPI